jgi:glycosyltransferase involved in cell wall biosynthesis
MIFLTCLYDKSVEAELLKINKGLLQSASNNYQWNIIEGLNSCGESLKIFNVLPVGTFPRYCSELFLKKSSKKHGVNEIIEIPCINIPIIKQYQRYKIIKKMLKESEEEEILIYSAYNPFLKAIYKLKDKKTTLIVTDLPEYYDNQNTNFLRKILRKINNKSIYKYLKKIDRFVLMTEYMKEPLKIGNRPYIIEECIISNSIKTVKKSFSGMQREKTVFMYAGTLNFKFGIRALLNAFSEMENKKTELWICGGGEASVEIAEYAEKNSRIKFYGFVTGAKVKDYIQKADIMVNPRPNAGEYTKYSFPSKTAEYMSSGKPVLMFKLDGIPENYDNYLYYVNEVDGGLKTAMDKISGYSDDELYEKARQAKKFIIENKNSQIQALKILSQIKICKDRDE